MADLKTARRTSEQDLQNLVGTLRGAAEPLPAPDDAPAFGALFDRFGDSRVVLLGEATHGSRDFYQARSAITRHLIEHHGFNIVAVEADWPDAARIDRYVRHHAPRPSRDEAFTRFPTWMWRNAEVMEFITWLRTYNADRALEQRASFHGLDVYSLGASMQAVLDYLDRVDPAGASLARSRYGCLTPWQEEPAGYGHAVLWGEDQSCEEEVTAQLAELLEKRLSYIREDGGDFFDAAQNARIVRAAEQYYRIMYRGARESWNLRDRHMFDTLQALMAHGGDAAKAVIWAHNSHIGNAAATAMGWQGEFNIGELCRTAYGQEATSIGFGTDRGTVAAANDWNEPMQVMRIRPARADSYEYAFKQTGLPRSLTDWRMPRRQDLTAVLSEPRLERAIGVIYRPESELRSHYFEAVLAEQFDAYVWFEETTAVTPLPAERPQGVPETYPFAV